MAVLLGGYNGRYFAPDRDFIVGAGLSPSVDTLREEIHDYMVDRRNRGWLRRRARIRVSTRRVKSVAKEYLPDCGGSRPPMEVPLDGGAPVQP